VLALAPFGNWESGVQEEEKPATFVPPYPLAMVVCDAIWKDPGTGKAFLLGLFSVIHAESFPAVHPIMAIHVAITDGRGKLPIRLKLVDANDEEREPLFDGSQEVEFRDPRQITEIAYHLLNVRFETPGEYRFQLFAGTEFLMERRVLVQGSAKGAENDPGQ
jgi:hypothetical protein